MCTTAEYAVKEVIKIYKLNNKEAEAKVQEAGSAQVWSLTPLSFCKRSLRFKTIENIKSHKPLPLISVKPRNRALKFSAHFSF